MARRSSVALNALLASDFSGELESWLGRKFNEGIPTIYDRAADAAYNLTHEGGGHLHRLFDGSHTAWGMWDKVRGATPDDTFIQEVTGYAASFCKDLSSKVGIPLADVSKDTYEKFASAMNESFGINRFWISDLAHVNAPELLGGTIGTLAVALNWDAKEARRFGSLASSLGISAGASANPALALVALVILARGWVQANKEDDFASMFEGIMKGGVGTVVFLGSASVVGGPVWIGLLTGVCASAIFHKASEPVNATEVQQFISNTLQKGTQPN